LLSGTKSHFLESVPVAFHEMGLKHFDQFSAEARFFIATWILYFG